MPFTKGKAHDIPFALINATSGAGLTGASVTAYRSLDGGAQAAVSGTITEKGSGQYLFEGLAADFNADDSVGLLFTASGAVPAHILLLVAKFTRNTAHDIPFLLLNASTGAGLTGASPAGLRILDGGAQASVSGTFSELGNGQYVFNGLAADFTATDVIGLFFTATNAVPVHITIDLVRVLAESDTLSSSPASVMRDYAVDQAYGTLPSDGDVWPFYVGTIPDGDNVEDDAGVFVDTTPIVDGRVMSGPTTLFYGIELLVRSRSRDDGWDKINAIAAHLDTMHLAEITSGGVDYMFEAVSRGGVNYLGLEAETTKRRYLHTLNMTTAMREI